jgi:hypothetical protein
MQVKATEMLTCCVPQAYDAESRKHTMLKRITRKRWCFVVVRSTEDGVLRHWWPLLTQ